MPQPLTHLLRSLMIAIVAGSLIPLILFRDLRMAALVLAHPAAWGSILAAGVLCAVASWQLRHTRSAARAGAAGFLWGTVIAATVAAFLAFTSTSLSVYGSRWEEKVIGKWSYVTLFAAPYVALWLGVYSWWVWRRAAVTGTSLDSAHSHRVKIPAAG